MLVIMNILGAFEGASSSLVGGDSMISFAIFRAYHNTHSHSLASASWCSTHGESQNAVVLSPPQHAPEVCLYVCTHVCVCICIYVYIVYTYICIYAHARLGSRWHTYTHTCTYTHTHPRERGEARNTTGVFCVGICIYIYVHLHIHI